MNFDDERTASPMAGDSSERLRTHANPSTGETSNDVRGATGAPSWAKPLPDHDAQGDSGFRSFSMPPPPPDGDRESVSISNYFRHNLPAILIVCIIAAAIGIAIGSHFAAEPAGQVFESSPADGVLKKDRIAESPATPSDTIMQRIEEMRRIAAEDTVDDVSGIAGATGTASAAAAAPAASVTKRPERGPDQAAGARQPQSATGSRSSGPCTAASMALALCDHQ